jgi:hypothetical protein
MHFLGIVLSVVDADQQTVCRIQNVMFWIPIGVKCSPRTKKKIEDFKPKFNFRIEIYSTNV